MNEYKKLVKELAKGLNQDWQERKREIRGFHPSHLVAELLEGASKKMEGFGAEGIRDEERGVSFQYVNVGDAYTLTVVFDPKEEKFKASTWADEAERIEREKDKFIEAQDSTEEASDEKGMETLTIDKTNQPVLVARLNRECEDRQAWEAAHPDKTVTDWLVETGRELKCESFGPLKEPPKGTKLWRINLKGRYESLFYDYIDHKFMFGTVADVLKRKEEEHEGYLKRLESLADRLNEKLPGFKDSDAPNLNHYVTDLLAEANKEIRGDGVFTADSENGIYLRYVDKCENPFIPTIVYDGNEKKFYAGSRDMFEKKQQAEHRRLVEKEDRAKFEGIAKKLNSRLAESEGMPHEDRDWLVYSMLKESMASMGGNSLSGLYQKGKGPVIDYVDIGERHTFTLVYDREVQSFSVGNPYELYEGKNAANQWNSKDIGIGQRVTFQPHDGNTKLTGIVKEANKLEVVLQCGRAIIPTLREKGTFAEAPEPDRSETKEYALEQALKYVGEKGHVFMAKGEDAIYRGAIVELTPAFAIQKVGEDTILHRLKDLKANKEMIHEGAEVSIVKGAKGTVTVDPWHKRRKENERNQRQDVSQSR